MTTLLHNKTTESAGNNNNLTLARLALTLTPTVGIAGTEIITSSSRLSETPVCGKTETLQQN